jgi:hypothetical protein
MKLPDKKLTILACWARRLHRHNICPLNHNLDYGNGWFYFDDDPPFHDPELIREAEQLMSQGLSGMRRYEGMREILYLVDAATGEAAA